MPERVTPRSTAAPILEVSGLNVHYGHSHALQGVELSLHRGVLSVVGRNGMGKTTLCKAIMGLVRASSGSIRVAGEQLIGRSPADIARVGIGYVPQGRRLWRSLSVDEHLRLVAGQRGAWSMERIYETFPRLAERKGNRAWQLSGGEQQMLAISRALLLNPRLLVMDEPTEGLAPVIVSQVEDILVRLADQGEMSVLVVEQNIGVATEVAENVAIMVNGRINRVMPSAQIAADRELQQRLLGVGRHGHADIAVPSDIALQTAAAARSPAQGPVRIYLSNPAIPTRWSQPVPVDVIEVRARTASGSSLRRLESVADRASLRGASLSSEPYVVVAGTLDTKGEEIRFLRDLLRDNGIRTRLVDLSTSGKPSAAEVPPTEVALNHRHGASGVFTGDRGRSVAGMAEAFENWIRRQRGIAGIISAGGSGGTSIATRAMRALPLGIPKVMISTVASGDVRPYVGPSDIMMMYSITDVQGLNSISRRVLANGAQAMAGMVQAQLAQPEAKRTRRDARPDLPAIGLTMFGVTTPCVQQITARLKNDYDCLVFHATGVGGQSMEKLIDAGLLAGAIDVTTTEICDMMMGGVLPATEDRFGAVIRTRLPYVGSCGALDMVNFGPRETVPGHYESRRLYQHNPQVTLMRTTAEENERMGVWIGERLNRMEGQVRFLLPEGGLSALDVPGGAFSDTDADAALFAALERTVRQTTARQLLRIPCHINDPKFADAVVHAFRSLHDIRDRRRRGAR